MAGITLHAGNRMEPLAEALSGVVAAPLADPFAVERIIVPNRGVGRWLSLYLAEKRSVFTNFSFLSPDGFFEEAKAALFPGEPRQEYFSPEVMTWRLMRKIGELQSGPSFAEVRGYTRAGETGAGDELFRRLQLSGKLAQLFELYQVFRIGKLKEWEADPGGDWQGELWRELAREYPGGDKASRFLRLANLPDGFVPPPGALPERVSLFGTALLAPVRLQILISLSRFMRVDLFILNPSRAYWGDIVSGKEMAKLAAKTGISPEELGMERGHPLLASLGKPGREFFESALSLGLEAEEYFRKPSGDSLLAMIQGDILDLADPTVAGEKRVLPEEDNSIDIRSCHGPVREVETLHDYLLGLFEKTEGLEPRDILVAATDIETYAPIIEAVFGGERDPGRRIPYTIADRSARSGGKLAGIFLRFLELPSGRFTVSEVVEILETEEVMKRWGFEAGDLELIKGWIEATRIRWGRDALHREKELSFAYEENSWRAAFDRLLLGYAMGGGREEFRGILPSGEIEGSESRTLGRLIEFCEFLFTCGDSFSVPKTLSEWSAALLDSFGNLLEAGEEELGEERTIRQAIGKLAELESLSGFAGPVDLRSVRTLLTKNFEESGSGGGYLRGRVTFSALRPFRSLPFRVIALLGMNDTVFPRAERRQGFDLLAKERLPQDPSMREEDRYLFLELLLSARDNLYVSYCGQSPQDNSERQPSVVVSELVDAVEEGFRLPREGKVREKLVRRERLQGFSPSYFEDGAFRSYSRENFEGAKALAGERKAPASFLPSPLPDPGPEWRIASPASFTKFFLNPAGFFMTGRLGLRFLRPEEGLEDRETFALSGLENYKLIGEMVEARLRCEVRPGELSHLRKRGFLPPGSAGEGVYCELLESAALLTAKVSERMGGALPSTLEVSVRAGEIEISGPLSGVTPGGLLLYRPGKLRDKDIVEGWVRHLLWNAADTAAAPKRTFFTARDKEISFRPVDGAQALLDSLGALFLRGGMEPLHLFPSTSLEYAKKVRKGETPEKSFKAALEKWEGKEQTSGEGLDPYMQRCFGETGPFAGDFAAIAETFFFPLLDHMEKP
ncbi:exodeoxyribonuclease V subunit gamma [bacterium]|nr:MAG: exodeoxyribonuclease V subunit gamma [bacterium]